MLEAILSGHVLAAESSGGIATLGVDWKALILQIVTFIIVFWLLKKFALAKIVKVLEERHDTIEKGVALGRQLEAEQAEWEAKHAERLRKARAEADDILAKAHQEAGEIIKDAEDAASRKADALMKDAQARIEDETRDARKSLEQDVLSLVAETTEVIIEEKLDSKRDNSLMGKALARVRSK